MGPTLSADIRIVSADIRMILSADMNIFADILSDMSAKTQKLTQLLKFQKKLHKMILKSDEMRKMGGDSLPQMSYVNVTSLFQVIFTVTSMRLVLFTQLV